MALFIEANYSKKLGLPGYSSHQYSLTLKTEVADVAQVSAKSQELHQLMQSCVDREIQHTGFLPNEAPHYKGNGNGYAKPYTNGHTNGNGNGYRNGNLNGNGHQRQVRPGSDDAWKCSAKQQALILKITEENKLDKNMVEQLAQDRFEKGVKQLNKLEASGLIEELIEKYPSTRRPK